MLELLPVVWCIGGSDSSGGSGIQADTRTLAALGVHACTVITAITAQNSSKVHSIQHTDPKCFRSQLQALEKSHPPRAIKIGMLGNKALVQELVEYLKAFRQEYSSPVICDPVLASTSGASLLGPEAWTKLKKDLLPLLTVMTPNLPEAEMLLGHSIRTPDQMEKAAYAFLDWGVPSVIIKGGHALGDSQSRDFWTNGQQRAWLSHTRIPGPSPRGTGCTFASALSAAVAWGLDVLDATIVAKAYVHQSYREAYHVGQTNTLYLRQKAWPASSIDLPELSPHFAPEKVQFPDCGPEPLGFYPIFDRASWLKRLLPLGIRTVQLRIKDLQGYSLEKEIAESIRWARHYACRLFINDHWEIALQKGAYGIHLGQEDLESLPRTAWRNLTQSQIRLGLSTHSYAELARAHSVHPSYIALGPIFPTTLKAMKFAPQGIPNLKIWRKLVEVPLVAIGGITLEKANLLLAAGPDGIAVVSDLTQNPNPEARTLDWLKKCSSRAQPSPEWSAPPCFQPEKEGRLRL